MGPPLPRRQSPAPDQVPSGLPIDRAAAEVAAAVATGSLVLIAEPGAGKSTVVPAWMAELVPGRVVVLEPRRLAARATATRLAQRWGEEVGGRVGLTVRGERRVSDRTRVEVVTEAILTRRVQDDPSLDGIGAVVFDEFHERSLHADLGLALALEVRDALRPDLVLVVMSATLDAGPVAALLGGAPVVRVPGRTHPVTTVHLPRPRPGVWAQAVADAAVTALTETTGDVLVFVPGRAEVDGVRRLLVAPPGVEVAALHGGVPKAEQQRLLADRRTGGRRIVVATSVAETSVTLPHVTAVVDGGRLRQPRYDERTGLGRLETVGVTRFAADQRRGRAGRTGPGRCYRLWPRDEDRHLNPSTAPEVLSGDPLPLAIELGRWGDPDGTGLAWLDPPPRDRLAAARRGLAMLGLASDDGHLTDAGRAAAQLPLHPRLAALVLTASEQGLGRLALTCAALLDRETAARPATGWDLRNELESAAGDRRLSREVERLSRRAGIDPDGPLDLERLGPLLAAAWPDRVAQRRQAAPDRYLLAGGGEVRLPGVDRPTGPELLVVADAGGLRAPPTISLAVPITRPELLRAADRHVTWSDEVAWDDRRTVVDARRRQRLGALVLHAEPHPSPPEDEVARATVEGVRRRGAGVLAWTEAGRRFQARVAFLRHHGSDLPDLGDDALLDRLDEWLLPALTAHPPAGGVSRLDPLPLIAGLLHWDQRRMVDRLAPAELAAPGRKPRPVDYVDGQARWAVRIQDLFGLDRHPTVLDGAVPVVVELLSPAGRPAQLTTDLPGFWRGSYRQVRAELRGRYPKHPWPDEPWVSDSR